jgi:hypothetical protein
MAWTLTDDITQYQSVAGDLLNADAVRNTVLLSVPASLPSRIACCFCSRAESVDRDLRPSLPICGLLSFRPASPARCPIPADVVQQAE